jgi:hypothetical protein
LNQINVQLQNQCYQTQNCTHYSWTQDKICFLKQGNVIKLDALFNGKKEDICGFVNAAQLNEESASFNVLVYVILPITILFLFSLVIIITLKLRKRNQNKKIE